MSFEADDEEEDDWFGIDMSPLLDLPPEAEAMVRAKVDAMRRPLSPGDPRRHHYVPQFFLRRFASEDQLARVRLERPDRHEVANVNNLAVMKDLYTIIDTEVGETVSVERFLADLDGAASGAIARLALGALFPPTAQDRLDLALWISMLNVRGPKTRRSMEALADQAMKMDMSLVHDEDAARARLRSDDGTEPTDGEVEAYLAAVEDMDSWEIAPHQNSLVRLMLDLGLRASPFLLTRKFAVVKFPEKGLILTDSPVTLYQKPENRAPFLGVGIGNADEVWLPLDRSTALILHSDEDVGERVIHAPIDHSVDDFNQAVISHAHREVYCHPEDLPRLRKLRFPDPNRPLFQVSGADFIKGETDGVNVATERKSHHRYRRDG